MKVVGGIHAEQHKHGNNRLAVRRLKLHRDFGQANRHHRVGQLQHSGSLRVWYSQPLPDRGRSELFALLQQRGERSVGVQVGVEPSFKILEKYASVFGGELCMDPAPF